MAAELHIVLVLSVADAENADQLMLRAIERTLGRAQTARAKSRNAFEAQ